MWSNFQQTNIEKVQKKYQFIDFYLIFKVCILIVLGTWVSSLVLYGVIVSPSSHNGDIDGYHFNVNGLMVCEPYFLSNRILILSAYLFYFPTTMVLMYCYGTVFHSTKAKLRYKQVLFSTFPCAVTGTNAAKRVTKVIKRTKYLLLFISCKMIIALRHMFR